MQARSLPSPSLWKQPLTAVLIDETAGRRTARQLGLTTIGVAGILVRASQAPLLSAIAPVLKELEQKANFWLAPDIRAEVLRLVGEQC